MFNKIAPEKPSTDRYMDLVLDRTECKEHLSPKGIPCWGVTTSSGLGLGAVCNARATKSGFNHRISRESLRTFRKK